MRDAWSRIPLYPVLLALAMVFVAQAEIGISLAAVVRSAVLASVVAVLVMATSWVVLRDLAAAGLIAGGVMILLRSGDVTPAVTGVLLVVLCAVLVAWTGRRSRRPWRTRATGILNGVAAALLAVGLGGSLYAEVASITSVPDADVPAPGNTTDTPDIYILLLDAYPRADSLERTIALRNDDFLAALEARGLAVSADARSNFMYTAPSLVSFFDLGQMGEVGRSIRTERKALRPSDLINRSPALELIEEAGYTTYASIARWERESLRAADRLCGTEPVNEFELHLVRSSFVGRVLDAVVPGWMAARDRSIIDAEFACARSAAEHAADGSKFVFAHVGAPHLPLVFEQSGSPAPLELYLDPLEVPAALRAEVDAAYEGQLAYVNRRALETIDVILAEADEPPVVIVMADHGSWLGIGTDYDESSDLRERFGILFAASTPHHPNLFPQDVTIGQVLPILFNAYLGTEIDVPDSRYFFSRTEDIFTLTEIPDPFRER